MIKVKRAMGKKTITLDELAEAYAIDDRIGIDEAYSRAFCKMVEMCKHGYQAVHGYTPCIEKE